MKCILCIILLLIVPTIIFALPKQPRNQRKCAIPQARMNPPAEVGRCQCGDFITQYGSITLGTTFCRCTPVYYPPQAPNIPATDDCAFDTSCTNSGGGPCQKFKYEEDPQRDIPDWGGEVSCLNTGSTRCLISSVEVDGSIPTARTTGIHPESRRMM